MEPESTTTISSQQRRLSIARAICRSSLKVMMVAVIFMSRGSESARIADGSQRKTQQENQQRQPSQLPASLTERGRVVNSRVPHTEKQQQHSPEQPARPEENSDRY